jgi:hypothetical protein
MLQVKGQHFYLDLRVKRGGEEENQEKTVDFAPEEYHD